MKGAVLVQSIIIIIKAKVKYPDNRQGHKEIAWKQEKIQIHKQSI